jgi:hypothetical protein
MNSGSAKENGAGKISTEYLMFFSIALQMQICRIG